MCPRGPVMPGADTRTASSPKPRMSVLFARLPPASTVTFSVSAPPLGEGLRMVLTAQSPGPEAWTLDGSLVGPHQARTARAPRWDPTSLHPGKQTPRYRWPVGFLEFMGGD